MTSTVLDVTVMLLCVSASVIALGTVGTDTETGADAAADAADRLATETATVTYEVDGGDHESRTVHATLVELLAASVRGPSGTDRETVDRFRSRVLDRVTDALDGRFRVDVRYETNDPSSGIDALGGGGHHVRDGDGIGPWTVTIGNEPPANADVTAAVLTHPGPDRIGSARIDPDGPGRFRIVVRAW
ncbi:hypothetical protein SAMN04488066_10761 [Halorubrum aquaticum]|uniref:Pilin/flagellin n=1 Tax=Halorubrum aquaticum TaxID=387340 RepID=A0A1I3AS95_9EURY|nr:hypothetical protein [Halorubrum aquaticum]SFH52894.1 hypothetical protein SAMN04488066_10761 [Halorubrum aquaticum]